MKENILIRAALLISGLWAVPCAVNAAESPPGVKLNVPEQEDLANATPFILFQTAAGGAMPVAPPPATPPVDFAPPETATTAPVKGHSPSDVVLIYTLRFLRGTLPTTGTAITDDPEIDAKTGADKEAIKVATFLNGFSDDTTITTYENRLIITGPAVHVNAIRQMLALSLDVPAPQVKADVYTIQINTTPHNRDAAQDKVEEIAVGVQIVRDLIHGSEGALGGYLGTSEANVRGDAPPPDAADARFSDNDSADTKALKDKLFATMKLVGYDPRPNRPLSLTDMLIFLVPSDRKHFHWELTPRPENSKLKRNLADRLESELNNVRQEITTENMPLTSGGYKAQDAKAYSRHSKQLEKLLDRIETKVMIARRDQTPVFGRLAGLYDLPKGGDMQGMCDFMEAWHACQGAFVAPLSAPLNTSGVDPREYPDWLASKSAATDLLLKEAMDALTGDLQDVYFRPLLDWIREDVRGTHAGDTGIDLVGTTSITMRDRMLVQTQGAAEGYFKFTPIPHLTRDLLAASSSAGGSVAAPPAGASGATADSAGEAGAPPKLVSTVFGALNPLQTLLLNAALAEDGVLPVYRKVTPGTSLAIRPFVLPDGGSARVQMSLTSLVNATEATPGQLAQRDVPFDTITSHTVTTEATISAFDLQTIASFGAQTTAPGDYTWRIPLLDQIPLLGTLFHGPRSAETKQQDSLAIVNLTILPRSLDLVPYYVAGSATK